MDDIKWFAGFLLIIGIIWLSGKAAAPSQPGKSATTTPKTQVMKKKVRAPQAPAVVAPVSGRTTEPQVQQMLPPHISPLRGKLSIGAVRRGSVDQEYVIIQASKRNTSDIDITGLTIRSAIGLIGHTIGNGWLVYFPNTLGDGEPILLRPGARAYLISGRPPNGVALPKFGGFQLNLCTGFLEQNLNFYPSLPLQCPNPKDGPLPADISDDCYDYLARLRRCTVPKSVPTYLESDGSCRAYAFNKINYGQCVADYRNHPNFFRGEWRIYFRRTSKLWRDRKEVVELLDREGKLIDARSY